MGWHRIIGLGEVILGLGPRVGLRDWKGLGVSIGED